MADRYRRKKEPAHVRLYHSTIDTAAWRDLSGNAIKVLLDVVRLDNGKRNGEIVYTSRMGAERLGLSERTCLRCLSELEKKGFLVCTFKGSFSQKLRNGSTWRYTWASAANVKKGPTREFEKWLPDRNSRQQFLRKPAAVSSNSLETSLDTAAFFAAEKLREPQKPDVSNSEKNAALTITQRDAQRAADCRQRKQSTTRDGELTLLRERLLEHLSRHPVGEQRRLAIAVGCPPGTFSKFVSGRTLPDRYREPLRTELRGGRKRLSIVK